MEHLDVSSLHYAGHRIWNALVCFVMQKLVHAFICSGGALTSDVCLSITSTQWLKGHLIATEMQAGACQTITYLPVPVLLQGEKYDFVSAFVF